MRRIEYRLALWPVLALWTLAVGCDQGPRQSNPPASGNPAATSSERKETHPQQPTGMPQSGEVPSNVPPSAR
jgi:hypothetical protein